VSFWQDATVNSGDAADRRIFVSIGPTGGRPTHFVSDPESLDPIGPAGFRPGRLRFGRGWTVYVDAPDADPAMIRCRSRAEAEELGRRIVTEADAGSVTALMDRLRRR
jgi:hypothetical protein